MCVDPVFSVPDSSAPSPPGSRGSGLYARQGGPTRVGPFLFVSGCVCPTVIPGRAKCKPRNLSIRIFELRDGFRVRAEAARPGMTRDQFFRNDLEHTLSPHPEEPRSSRGVSKDRGPSGISRACMVRDARKGRAPHHEEIEPDRTSGRMRSVRFSAATCTPRPASGPVSRGCRPGHRPPRRRRRRASGSRSAPSSFPDDRSSRRP